MTRTNSPQHILAANIQNGKVEKADGKMHLIFIESSRFNSVLGLTPTACKVQLLALNQAYQQFLGS
jgi:hypothetical protein